MLRERESDKCEAKYRYYLHWHFESTKSSRLAENATDESDDANAFVNGDLREALLGYLVLEIDEMPEYLSSRTSWMPRSTKKRWWVRVPEIHR